MYLFLSLSFINYVISFLLLYTTMILRERIFLLVKNRWIKIFMNHKNSLHAEGGLKNYG